VSLVEQLRLEHPIVQAGMGGGIANAELAAAVSNAGALGTIGILPPRQFDDELRRARERAPGRPISANLLVPFARGAHVESCARHGVELVVLHAGFDRDLVRQLHAAGTLVFQTVGTVPEAKRALAEGADGLVVQGVEAGGHLVGVTAAREALERIRPIAGARPLLLAGGIADAADVERALDAGAAAVVAGTRFLLTHESGAHDAYKEAVLRAERTLQTQLFGLGWPMRHRVVPNAATERWCRPDSLAPRGLAMLQQLSVPIQRLPLSLTAASIKLQRAGLPIFGPSPPTKDSSAASVDTSALYAGDTALRIDSVLPAAEAVSLLAGNGSESPTMRPT
jgi:NAD(P)H-dependent flavin oxidoreductase YrpB (nitropropane dioxygenase family)